MVASTGSYFIHPAIDILVSTRSVGQDKRTSWIPQICLYEILLRQLTWLWLVSSMSFPYIWAHYFSLYFKKPLTNGNDKKLLDSKYWNLKLKNPQWASGDQCSTLRFHMRSGLCPTVEHNIYAGIIIICLL